MTSKSFVKAIIASIPQATPVQMAFLAQLILKADIHNGHLALITVWTRRVDELKISKNESVKDVARYLQQQKEKYGHESKGMDSDLNALHQVNERLGTLLRDRETGLQTWQLSLAEEMFEMQRLIANIVG
ncbi:MAG: hypothetical protein RL094_420 [Candidatus Parcubacteria bacterium]|jgi:hypothetical protein